jgi:hypothetical protein
MKHTTEKRGAGTTEKRPSHTSGAGKHLSQATRGTIRPPNTR